MRSSSKTAGVGSVNPLKRLGLESYIKSGEKFVDAPEVIDTAAKSSRMSSRMRMMVGGENEEERKETRRTSESVREEGVRHVEDDQPANLCWVKPCSTRFDIPFLAQIKAYADFTRSAQLTIQTQPTSASGACGTANTVSRASKKMTEPDRWLLLACTDQLDKLDMAPPVEESLNEVAPVVVRDYLYLIQVLLNTLGARVDVQDPMGWSVVHWLFFYALWQPVGTAVIHGDEVNLDGVTRYQTKCEPVLMILLAASEKIGYSNDCKRDDDFGAEDPEIERTGGKAIPEGGSKGNLLDLQDNAGNTALHYCIHRRRVDLVGLLLCHGASVDIPNLVGTTARSLVGWKNTTPFAFNSLMTEQSEIKDVTPMDVDEDKKQTGHLVQEENKESKSTLSTSHIHPLIAGLDTSIYASAGHIIERRWGVNESLRIEQCSYSNETDEEAIKRLLFQQLLFNAVNEDPAGNVALVKCLVQAWLTDYESGRKMFPLVYRGDAFHLSPLQVAVAYETEDTTILEELLKLPWLFHIQSRAKELAPMHAAITCNNKKAVVALSDAGYEINHRDIVTGATPLCVVCGLQENEAVVLHHCRTLRHLGASPLIPNEDGNSPLTICVTVKHLSALKFLLKKLEDNEINEWLLKPNRYGNTPMHYALYCEFPITEDEVNMVVYLISLGGVADRPKNSAGLTPLAVCTVAHAPGIEHIAEALQYDVNYIIQAVEAHYRKKVKLSVFNKDLTLGIEHPSVSMITEFEMRPDDSLVQFNYVSSHQTGQFSDERVKAFVDMRRTSLEQQDSSTQQHIFHIDSNPIPRIPCASLEVRMTRSKGWGLFAKRTIPIDHGLEVIGEIITAEEAEMRDLNYQEKNQFYILPRYRLYDGISIFGIDNSRLGNLSHFVNHSCEGRATKPLEGPNLTIVHVDSGRSCVLMTKRTISVGEELTVNYGYTRLPRGTIVCECESRACLGKFCEP